MADETRKISLEFQTNASAVKNSVDSLNQSLDKNSAEYAQLSLATSELAEAEYNLVNAQKAVADSADHTASSQANLQKKLLEAQSIYDKSSTNVGGLVNKLGGAEKATTSFGTSMKNSGKSVLENGGAIAVLDQLTGGYATQLKDIIEATGVFTSAQEASTVASGEASVGVKGFGLAAKSALIATGIGVFVVLLGTIVSYWDDIKGSVTGVGSAMKEANETAQEGVDASQEQLDILNSQDNILKLQGKSEKEILAIKTKQTDEAIRNLEVLLETQKDIKKAQVEASQRNRDILSGILKFISAPITLLLMTIDQVGKAFGKSFNLMKGFDNLAELVFDPKETAEEGDKTIKETEKKLLALKNTRAGYINSQNEANKAAGDKAATDQKAIDDAIKAKAKQLQEDLENIKATSDVEKLKLEKDRSDAEIKLMEGTAKQKEELLKANALKYKALTDAANAKQLEAATAYSAKILQDTQNLEDSTDREKLNRQKERELQLLEAQNFTDAQKKAANVELMKKFAVLDALQTEKELTSLKDKREKELATDKIYEGVKTESELESRRIAFEKLLEQAREQAMRKANELPEDTPDQIKTKKQTIFDIDNEFRAKDIDAETENAKAKKDLKEEETKGINDMLDVTSNALASAAQMSTEGTAGAKAVGIASALISTYKGIAAGVEMGMPAGIPSIIAASAAGFATVKKITSVKVPGNNATPTAAVPTAVTATGPNVNFVASSENQIASSITKSQKDQPPIKAFVVSSEMTQQQTTDSTLANRNTL